MGADFSHDRLLGLQLFALRSRRAVSLLETIIVLFIIGLMMALLFPAVQAARHRALVVQCQNNIRQLQLALGSAVSTQHRFPTQSSWTIDCLRWIEEQPLADVMAQSYPKSTNFPRPPLMRCPAQPDDTSTVPGVGVCHYVLVVNRPKPNERQDHVSGLIMDRAEITDKDPHDPWYLGPEIDSEQQRLMLTTRKGPHPGGMYYDGNGQSYPAN